MPWRKEEGGHAIVGQDFRKLASEIDVFSPMLYYPLNHRPIDWIKEMVTYFKNETRLPVWPIFFSGDSGHPVSLEELKKVMKISQESGAESFLFISFDKLADQKKIDKLFLE